VSYSAPPDPLAITREEEGREGQWRLEKEGRGRGSKGRERWENVMRRWTEEKGDRVGRGGKGKWYPPRFGRKLRPCRCNCTFCPMHGVINRNSEK